MAASVRWLQLFAVAAVILASASCFVVLKAGLEHAPPLRLAALRLLVGGSVLLALLPVMGTPLLPRRDLWPWIIVLGLAVTAFSYGAMAVSLGSTGAGIASVLGNSQPLLAVALGVWLFSERLSRTRLLALVLGFAGLVMVAFPVPSDLATEGGIGPLLALASSVGLVVASVVVKHVGPEVSRLVLAAWPLVLGGIALFAFSLTLEPGREIAWSPQFVALLLFLALPGTALLTLLWYWLLRHGDLGRLSLFFYAVPAVGLGLSWVLYAEPIAVQQWFGIAFILLAVVTVLCEEWSMTGGKRVFDIRK